MDKNTAKNVKSTSEVICKEAPKVQVCWTADEIKAIRRNKFADPKDEITHEINAIIENAFIQGTINSKNSFFFGHLNAQNVIMNINRKSLVAGKTVNISKEDTPGVIKTAWHVVKKVGYTVEAAQYAGIPDVSYGFYFNVPE